MADKKISALTAATTPLAGTEVLPIVQSGTTVKATVLNVQVAPVSTGTANGVQYLNASKVPTTGTAITFDGTNLGIGNSVPIAKLQVGWSLDQFKVTNPSPGFKQIGASYTGYVSGNDYSAIILGTDGSSGGKIQLSVTPSAGVLTTAVTIDQNGNTALATGNLVIGTAGKGIDFSATASGSGTMTSELLADYEEGTFTPVFSTTGTDFTSVTYSKQNGIYTRVGNVVYIAVELVVSALTAGSPTGDLVVAGYPFTISSTYTPALSIGVAGAYTTNTPSVAQARAGNTMSRLYSRAAANGGLSAMSPSELTSTSTIVLSGFYFV